MENGSSFDTNGSKHEHLHENISPDLAMNKIKTAGSISISPALFEKLYLSPQNNVKGNLRQTFGNPTAIGLTGHVISIGPLAADLMGWRGAGGSGAASIPFFLYFGGVLMTLGGILEFFLGNTFPSVVFVSFGAFWLSYGGLLLPQLNAYAAYAPPDAESIAEGLETTGFNASFGFVTLSMGILCFMYLACSIRTNIAFVIVFLTLLIAFGLITGAYWALALDYTGNGGFAANLLEGAGAASFVCTAASWWILFSLMFASVDMPFSLPLGDLSTRIPGASDKKLAQD
ncbi:GPR1/FUN34/YaaH-class plasma membrane protein [Xylaria bambusicola]|uniref:GPR1/FUN34/YaaH-class plasma membrane protein n=1 Tax=Xylaria bambusicola TaxID=326684 RepID=UPI0020086DDD|nr:GPR1/FUN34/YaaH-class plasma membrane protein [Xylaria bambusicola]KAI0521648.1 GPR1/FUN34/YaaH-class plasma membrane protein [Xylaria bambusicola]